MGALNHCVHKVSSISIGQQRKFNQIDHIAIKSRITNFLLDVRDKRGVDIDPEQEYYLMVACIRFHIVPESTRQEGKPGPETNLGPLSGRTPEV